MSKEEAGTADLVPEPTSRDQWKYVSLLAVLAIIPAFLVLLAMLVPWNATFAVQARSGIVEIEIGEQIVPSWYFRSSRVLVDERTLSDFEGALEIQPQTSLRVVRVAQDVFRISVSSGPNAEVAARLSDASGEIVAIAKSSLNIEINPEGLGVVLPIAGSIVIGDVVGGQGFRRQPILEGGTLSILGRDIVGAGRFDAGSFEFGPGDRFSVVARSGAGSAGYGHVSLERGEPAKIVYHAVGVNGRVDRFGSEGYPVRPSIWSRIAFDPVFQVALALYAPGAPIFAAVSFVRARRRQKTSDA